MTDIDALLRDARVIAVVGASNDAAKAANAIPRQMQAAGYRIVPVNPVATEILGEPVRRSLAEVEGPIDIVNVFRPAAEAPGIVRDAVAAGARAVWLQSGIRSDEAAAIAEEAGIAFVQDACIGVERGRRGIRAATA